VTTFVLVHGAWHGAWCWAALQAELDRHGVPSIAVDLPGHGGSAEPLTGLHGDAAALGNMLDRLQERGTGPVVLVGHSYGGAVITHAATGRNDIRHLVYIAAFALDDGESIIGALGTLERHDVALAAAMMPTADGAATNVDPELAPDALYGQCDPHVVAAALLRLSPQPMATMIEAVAGSPRSAVDSTYVVCLQDRAVHPAHQEVFARRCTNRVELDTDHSPFISAVDDVAAILEAITR
jgi:pimeloyl-ACP methyl ester carboxylesterase